MQAVRPATLLKRDSNNRCFPVKFAKLLRIPFHTEQLLAVSATEEQANSLLGQQSTGSTKGWYSSLPSAKSPNNAASCGQRFLGVMDYWVMLC